MDNYPLGEPPCMDNFYLWTEGLKQMMCALHMPI